MFQFIGRSVRRFLCKSILGKNDLHKKRRNKTYFHCEICALKCVKKSDFDKHNMTAKYKRLTMTDKKKREKNIFFIVNFALSNA